MRSMETPAHLLVIEDDPAVARSLLAALQREGYRAHWCDTAHDGIAYARRELPHLILLDLRLPDLSGLDVMRELRRLGLRQPVLILTVQGDEMDKVLGLELGADDYLTKPYALRELLARIRALLRRAYGELSQAAGDLLFVADLVVDRQRALVLRGETPLELTPTEFRLLVYLARNAGYALSRDRIIADVWGYGSEIEDERTVDVHIRRLREKIELDPGRPRLILTVPGIGYRLAG